MQEQEFIRQADAMMAQIEAALEDCQVDLDYEAGAGGIIEIECAVGRSMVVINRHVAAQEIWIAARSGGYHFRIDPAGSGEWVDTRDGTRLMTRLSLVLSEQMNEVVRLA